MSIFCLSDNIFGRIIPALLAAVTLLTGGCKKELDIDYHDTEAKTVIEATLTADGACVTIRNTTPMDEPMDLTNLSGADASLTDLDMGLTEILLPDTESRYVSKTPGIPGHTYQVEVLHGGCRYLSTCVMTAAPKITGVEFSWYSMPYDDVAALQVSIADNNPDITGECYWVRIYRNGEPYMWSAVKDDMAVDGIINEVLTTTRKETEDEDEKTVLVDGDVVGVSVTRISRAFLDYLEAISNDSNGPAMFKGDFCLGYFLAGEVSETSVIFHPGEIDHR